MVKNLRTLRTKNGLSQQQLAEIVGVTQQSINNYENHKVEPDIQMLMTLASFFHTSVDYLIGYTEIPHVIEPVRQYDLNNEEAALVEGYRTLTDNERHSIQLIIKNYQNK